MQPQDIAVHIDSMKERFAELEEKLAAPEIYSKPAECKALSRERQCLAGIFSSFDLWNRTLDQIRENRELLEHETDPDFLALLQSDLAELERKSQEIEQQLTIALIPRDSADARDKRENVASLMPPRSLSDWSSTSARQPFFSANLRYMRNISAANSAASSPPAAGRISTMVSRARNRP